MKANLVWAYLRHLMLLSCCCGNGEEEAKEGQHTGSSWLPEIYSNVQRSWVGVRVGGPPGCHTHTCKCKVSIDARTHTHAYHVTLMLGTTHHSTTITAKHSHTQAQMATTKAYRAGREYGKERLAADFEPLVQCDAKKATTQKKKKKKKNE